MEIRNAVKENMKQWIVDGTKMSAQIDADRGNSPTPTTNMGGSKSEITRPSPKVTSNDEPKKQPTDSSKGGKSDGKGEEE